MALAATTLASAKAVNDRVIRVTSGTGAVVKGLVLVNGEVMRITDISLSPTIGVVPGYNGTTAGPHGILAPVVFGLTTDFMDARGPDTQSFGADGAITGPGGAGTVPTRDVLVFLTKASAGAYTLAAPAIDQQNTITFISTTAAAHVVTIAGNAADKDVATWPATVNNMLAVKAQNGGWAPRAAATPAVTVA